MRRLHIVGRKNSGKTTLMVDLVAHLTARGFRVGTIKHTHHQHELDTPGKDSHRHRTAGAAVVGILSPALSAVFVRSSQPHDAANRYDVIAPLFEDCDFVLVEGDAQAAALKVEVWRSECGQTPLAATDRSILAVVTDDPVSLPFMVLARNPVATIAGQVLKWVGV
jgi:molybdopterin-guanine dinucleotide biosynthesis adapter protein